MEIDTDKLNKIIMAVDIARDELVIALYMTVGENHEQAADLVNGAAGMLDQAIAILNDERIDQ